LKTSLSRKRLSRSHDIGEAVTVGAESRRGCERLTPHPDSTSKGGQRRTSTTAGRSQGGGGVAASGPRGSEIGRGLGRGSTSKGPVLRRWLSAQDSFRVPRYGHSTCGYWVCALSSEGHGLPLGALLAAEFARTQNTRAPCRPRRLPNALAPSKSTWNTAQWLKCQARLAEFAVAPLQSLWYHRVLCTYKPQVTGNPGPPAQPRAASRRYSCCPGTVSSSAMASHAAPQGQLGPVQDAERRERGHLQCT